jgi:hypothetical protein
MSFLIVTALLTFAFLAGTLFSYRGLRIIICKPVTRGIPLVVASFFVAYLSMIPLNIKSELMWLSLILFFSFGFLFFSFSRFMEQVFEHSPEPICSREKIGVTAALLMWFGYVVLSTPLIAFFHDEPFKNAMVIENKEDFKPESVLLDGEQARFVDQELAVKGVKELIGEQLGLGSRFEFDGATIQQVNSGLNWVAPLAHKGIIKWYNNRSTPGYAYISVNDYDESALVINDSAEINFGNTGFYFSSNVFRHVYSSGYSNEIMSENPRFEITDNGNASWVFTTYENSAYLTVRKPNGVITVDAKSGDIKKYELHNAPKWIDTIYTDEVTTDLISYTLGYIKGAINAWFIGEDVITASEGTYMVYTKGGNAKWYTGMQSSGAQEGTMGFVLSDTRTGVATLYRKSGITENVAKKVAQGLVQDLGYISSAPIPHNVNGINTFVSILKDTSGNKQGVALVRYINRNVSGWGKSLKEAERRYMTSMAEHQDDSPEISGGSELFLIQDKVKRVTHLNDVSYIMLSDPEYKDNMFSVSHAKEMKVVISKPGDIVTIKVVSLDIPVIPAVDFHNDTIDGVERE